MPSGSNGRAFVTQFKHGVKGVFVSAAVLVFVAGCRTWLQVSNSIVDGTAGLRKLLTMPGNQLRLSSNPFPEAMFNSWLQGLQPLPASHGPSSSSWTNSFAICATMKDENLTDVREWIYYYRWLGVDHIFLTDNNSENSDWMLAELRREFPDSLLTVRSETEDRSQMKTYAWCAEEQRENYNWLAFFDLDEFLVIQDGSDLRPFMDQYKNSPALSVHWIWVGPSSQVKRPATGGVLPYYTMCSDHPDTHVKTITNTFFLEGLDVHPHNFRYRDNGKSVNENHRDVPPMWKGKLEYKRNGGNDTECGFRAKELREPTVRDDCFISAGAITNHPVANKVALFHYATKSLEDFSDKMVRGSGMSKKAKTMDYFSEISRMQSDKDWCKRPVEAAQKCCSKIYPELFPEEEKQKD